MKRNRLLYLITIIILVITAATQAQTSINSTGNIPNSSAMLDVSATNKGLLIPNIALTGSTDVTTIPTPALSLLVYNTATVSNVTPGYYYNSGTTVSPVWTRLGQATGTTSGQMQYWNGTAWVIVVPGTTGQVLTLINGVPTWYSTGGVIDVFNPTTGALWMDRNLGATQVATSSTDAASYGFLYQWGRGSDGHQIRTSATTTTLSNTDVPGHGNFIIVSSSPNDWRSPQNNNLWQGANGVNNPCPAGHRLPTVTELNAERASWISQDAAGAFASPLKFPSAGYRPYNNGLVISAGINSFYYSSNINNIYAHSLVVLSNGAYTAFYDRGNGYSVRCIKD